MTTISRRTLLSGLAATATVTAIGGCGTKTDNAGGEVQRVRLGYTDGFNGASVFALAHEQGLWSKHGLQAEANVFTNGPIQVQAFGSGDLDIGSIGPGALWLAATGKAKVIAINSLGFADRVIAQPGIDSMAKLKGKRVGVPEGTSGDMILRLALEDAGLAIGDVQKFNMDPSTVVTAFSSGQIDAAGIWYPHIETIKKRVPNLVELATTKTYYPELTFPSVFIARNEFVSANPELLQKVLRVIQDANDYRVDHIDEAVEITAAFLKGPTDQLKVEADNVQFLKTTELASKTSDGTAATWLAGLNDMFVGFGKFTGEVDPKTYYTAEAYLAAAKRD